MAVEQEELKLTVALDDQASEQLGNLQKALQGVVTAASPAASGLREFAKSLHAAGGHAHEAHVSLHALFARGGLIGGFFFEVGKGLAHLVEQFAEAVLDIQKYAESMVKLDDVSRRAATSMGQFQANVASLRESGISGDEATKILGGYANALAELQRPNSRILQDLLRGQQGVAREEMMDLVRTVMSSDQQTGINAIREAGKQIREYWEGKGQGERGAEAEASFYARLGMPGLEKFRGHLRTITAEQKRMYEDRRVDAEKYTAAVAKQQDAWERSVKSVQAIAFEILPINKGAEKAGGVFSYMAEGLEALERAMRNTNSEIDKEASEAQRKKVVTPEGREITAQEGTSEDPAIRERLRRRMNPRRSTTTRPNEALPPNLSDIGDVGDVRDVTGGASTPPPKRPTGTRRYEPRPGTGPGTGGPYRRVGLLGGEVEAAGTGEMVARLPGGEVDIGALGIPSIGEMLGPKVSDVDTFNPADYAGTGWRGLPMSKNVIDLRADKQSSELAFLEEHEQHAKLLTEQIYQLNEYLAPELMRMLLAGTGAPDFHNAPQGGAEGESNPVQLPLDAAQPGGGAAAEARQPSASEAAQAARAEPRTRMSIAMQEAATYLGKNETQHQAMLADYMQTGGRNLKRDDAAWCARFVDAIQTRAGLPSLESSLPEGQKAGQKEDRTWSSLAYKDWGRAVGADEDIREGDVMVKQRKGGGHVGVATGNYRVNEQGVREYEMLSGNIGGKAKGGGEVNYTWETLGTGAGGETTAGAGHGGIVAVRRGEAAQQVAEAQYAPAALGEGEIGARDWWRKRDLTYSQSSRYPYITDQLNINPENWNKMINDPTLRALGAKKFEDRRGEPPAVFSSSDVMSRRPEDRPEKGEPEKPESELDLPRMEPPPGSVSTSDEAAWHERATREAEKLGPSASGRANQFITDQQAALMLMGGGAAIQTGKLAAGGLGAAAETIAAGRATHTAVAAAGVAGGEVPGALNAVTQAAQYVSPLFQKPDLPAAPDYGPQGWDGAKPVQPDEHSGYRLDSAALDRAIGDQIQVNQNGQLSVDVRAPEGTTVKAEGGGVFNRTETNRTMPIEQPPEERPQTEAQ